MTQSKTRPQVIDQEQLLKLLWRDSILPHGEKPAYFPGNSVRAYNALIGAYREDTKYLTHGPYLSQNAARKAVEDLGRAWDTIFEEHMKIEDVQGRPGRYMISPIDLEVSRHPTSARGI